jgi:hypothetical protein
MSSKKLIVLTLVASLCVAACSRDKEKEKQATPATPPVTGKFQSQPPPPTPEILVVKGKVLEIIDAGGFTYVSMEWNGKTVWVTVPPVDLKVGEVISLDHATLMKNFHSTALNRSFDELIMASGVEGKSPRSRVAKSANPNDPRNRRSGKIMVTPAPAPPKPTGKVAGQTSH